MAATLARKLMAALYKQLGSGYEEPEVSDLGWTAKSSLTRLNSPLSAGAIARAYELLRDVRRKCVVKDPELGKRAALALREVLVFLICCTGAHG